MTSAAGVFARAFAHVSQHLWEWYSISDHISCSGRVLFADMADVHGNVNSCGTGMFTGDQRFLAILPFRQLLLIHDRAGGTDLGASSAEPASGFGERKI